MSSTYLDRPSAIDVVGLRELVASGHAPRILDVRTPAEFETAHIPSSYNVPLDLLREHRAELSSHLDENVVLVCRSGARATQAEQSLAEAGLPNVKVLAGGILAWQAADAPVNRGTARWDLERQVRFVAGLVVLLSIAVSVFVPSVRYVAGAMGLGLALAALTNTCLMGMLLARLPYNRGASCDLTTIVSQLRDAPPAGSRR